MKITRYAGCGLSAEFWNRTYTFDGLPVPVDILSGGRSILAAPVSLDVGFHGRTAEWTKRHLFEREPAGNEHAWVFSAEAGNVILNAEVRFEDDGLLWVDLLLIPHWLQKPSVTDFSITVPLKREFGELVHFWPVGSPLPADGNPTNSSFIPADGLHLPFRPAVWAGNETCGLCLYMESDRNVFLDNPQSMISFIPQGDALLLRVRLFDRTPHCWAEEDRFMERALPPLKYSFGLHATPVRPMEKVEGFNRIAHLELKDFPEDPAPMAGELADIGVKWVALHEDWSIVQNYGLPQDESRIDAITGCCHAHGMRVIAYFGYEYSTLAPGFAGNYDRYCVKDADGRLMGGWQRHPMQRDYVVCYAGQYREEMLERVKHAMDRYRLDGIYTDGTFEPWACANDEHGCGYEDETGRRRVTFPVRALREHVRRIRDAVHARGGIVDAHQSSCCVPAVLGYADSYLDGEHIQPNYNKDIGFLDSGAFRSEYTGVNWGIPSQFIVTPGEGRTFAQCCGLPLLYNIDCRASGMGNVREASRIWRVLDGFGAEDAAFHPFWREDCPVKTGSGTTRASCWIRDGRALILLCNIGKEPEEVRFIFCGCSHNATVNPLSPHFIELPCGDARG